jgi:protein-disulfide isomerase
MASVAILSVLLAGCGDDQGNVVAPPPSGKKVEAIAPPAGKEWTQVVSETPEGGFLQGNPQAPVKLLEYGSFGCSHCALFESQTAPLEELVKSGRVSWEFRSYLIFPTDPALSLLTRCHGPAAFFLLKQQLYATQPEWIGKLQQAAAQIEPLPPEQRLKPIVQATGLDAFFRQRGMPQAKIDSCLADKAALTRVLEIHNIGNEKYNVGGTPTFFVNGVNVKAGEWHELEPFIKEALGE